MIQDQHSEIFEVFYIMKGNVGVGYRLFNEIFLGLVLQRGRVINDYALITSKVSEFLYQPILENVEGFALRREHFNELLSDKIWRKCAIVWERIYLRHIQSKVREHREEKAEMFENRLDYCDMKAFGVGVDDEKKPSYNNFEDLDTDQNIINSFSGFGMLISELKKLDKVLTCCCYQLLAIAMKHDYQQSKLLGLDPLGDESLS